MINLVLVVRRLAAWWWDVRRQSRPIDIKPYPFLTEPHDRPARIDIRAADR